MIVIENDGPELVSTSYWESELAANGFVYLTINAGCFRLIAPAIAGLSLAKAQGAECVLVTRGAWPAKGRPDGLELLFDDHSSNPYAIHIVTDQCDHLPLDSDKDRPGQLPRWILAIYTEAGKMFELPARYRIAESIPCLKAWG